MRVLVTGGAGYIGSHTCLALLQGGHEVVALDNLCNSDARALERVQQIAGKPLTFYEADIRDAEALWGASSPRSGWSGDPSRCP